MNQFIIKPSFPHIKSRANPNPNQKQQNTNKTKIKLIQVAKSTLAETKKAEQKQSQQIATAMNKK